MDPIGELGSATMYILTLNEVSKKYCFVNNDVVNKYDYLGLECCPSFGDYWGTCMEANGMPVPSNLFGSLTATVATLSTIIAFIEKFGAGVTIADLVGAGLLGEWALAASAGLASWYVGIATSCAAQATGELLDDTLFGCDGETYWF